MRRVHLTMRNRGGSVEHFYHYLFGYLIPLCHYLGVHPAGRPGARLLLRSCGPMDRILRELALSRLKRQFARLATERGLIYRPVIQAAAHAPVPPTAVVAGVRAVTATSRASPGRRGLASSGSV